MTKRANHINEIKTWLSYLRAQVELSNSLNLQDMNVYAENFFRDFLNLIYDYKLENANYKNPNAKAIDLFDNEKKLVIQVTSDNSSQKIHDTINGFNEGTLFDDCNRLIMFIITTKKEFPKANFGKVKNSLFNKAQDIIDLADLLKDIENFNPEKLEKVHDFIINQVALKAPLNERRRESTEVQTIMRLIEYLSKNSSETDDSSEKEPNPEKKIMLRFADYSDYLLNTYKESAYLYLIPVQTAEKEIGLDNVTVKKIQRYLKRKSNEYLSAKQGNPKEAINEMAMFFNSKLSDESFNFDEFAAEFYLIYELIRCNVFPNP
jgi:hypothetical protein